MNAKIELISVKKLTEINNYWKKEDYFNILKLMDIAVSESLSENELYEYLQMSVSEMEPNEAAEVLLSYKLEDHLNENQISQIALDMLIDKIVEEYPEINLHYDLYNINQLLFKLYNGKFPNTIATEIIFEIEKEAESNNLTKEQALKYINLLMNESNLIKRLFDDKLLLNVPFEESNDIVWQLNENNNQYSVITSEYWISKEDFIKNSAEIETMN